MLKYVFIYFILGLMFAIIASIIMMYKALKKGYSIEEINNALIDLNGPINTLFMLGIIFGMIIWPIRAIQSKNTYNMIMNKLKETKGV